MSPQLSNGADLDPKTWNLGELRENIKTKSHLLEQLSSKIKEASYDRGFKENENIKTANFLKMVEMIDHLIRIIKEVIGELKNALRDKEFELTELVKSKNLGMDCAVFEGRMHGLEDQISALGELANGISEEAGYTLADVFEVVKDTYLSTYFISSVHSEFDLVINASDSISPIHSGLKMQILLLMKPVTTHRYIPSNADEEPSGTTTYQQILEKAMVNTRLHRRDKEAEKLQEEIGRQMEADDEMPTLLKTKEELMATRVKTLRPSNQVLTPSPLPLMPDVTVLREKNHDIPAAEMTFMQEQREPVSHKITALALKPVEPMRKPEPSPFVPPKAIKQSEEKLSSPPPIIKKTRSKIWALLGAGVALAAAAIYSQSGDDNSKNADTATATSTSATSHQTSAPSLVEQKTNEVENQKKAPKYTVNTNHADYTKYTSNFAGMHSFLADVNYAASHSEFEMTGSETPNQVKLKALRGFLEAGMKTATGRFSQKSFASYLNNLNHLEAEIGTGRIDINSENLMKDGRYHQIRLMAEGIKNVVPAAPPENIAGYKIDQSNCHPLEVFTNNYLRAGGAPAFHTTVMNTLETISHEPFIRNDTSHVTTEFFSRLHRQAAIRKAKNKVDGSPMVARSVEKFIRAGGRNEISEMLRGCLVPVYKDQVNVAPNNDDTVNTKDAVPIKYTPSAPSPTGLNDTQKSQEWNYSWGEKSDTDAILGNITEMLADDEPEIELTEADIINDDEPEIELTEEDIIIEEEPAPVKKSFFARAASKVKGLFA